jgi:hypothetical protein
LPSFELGHAGAADEAEARTSALGQQLRGWIEDGGGFVHPALHLSLATPHGRHALLGAAAAHASLGYQPLSIAPRMFQQT